MCMRRLRINLGCILPVRAQEYADRLVKQALARSARREGSPVSDESEDDGPELQYMKQAWAIARVPSASNGRIESSCDAYNRRICDCDSTAPRRSASARAASKAKLAFRARVSHGTLRGPCGRVTYTTKCCPLACVRAVSRRRRRYSIGIRYVQEQIEREVIDGINKHPPRPLTHTTPPSLPLPPSAALCCPSPRWRACTLL